AVSPLDDVVIEICKLTAPSSSTSSASSVADTSASSAGAARAAAANRTAMATRPLPILFDIARPRRLLLALPESPHLQVLLAGAPLLRLLLLAKQQLEVIDGVAIARLHQQRLAVGVDGLVALALLGQREAQVVGGGLVQLGSGALHRLLRFVGRHRSALRA